MMSDLKPYPAIKDSGVPWLGAVPEHWKDLRARYLFREIDRRSQAGTETHLSMSQTLGLVPSSMVEQRTLLSESYAGGKLCDEGDLILNRLKAHLGVFAMAKQTGVVSPDYTVLRRIRPMDVQYFEHVLRSPACRHELRVRAKGIVEGFWRLYTDDFYEIRLPVPPIDEQAAIVRFIDHADRRIRRYIRAKQSLIQLLAEERERDALTHAAGHSPDTRTLRLGAVADRVARPVDRRDAEMYTPIGLFNRGRGIFHKKPTAGVDLGDSTFFWIEEGDLVLSGQFAWEGAIALAGHEDTGCVATHRYPVLRGKPEIVETAYLFSFFRTRFGHFLLNEHARGAAGRNRPLNAGTLMKEKIPIPPLLEQQRIVTLVSLEKQLAGAVSRLSNHLREYRTRLIADLVTGKLDVREAAARLPDETVEPEPLEDTDVPAEGDEESESVDLDTSPEEAIS